MISDDSVANRCGVLFSGGLDSSILVSDLLNQGERVQPLYVHSSLHWEARELSSARQFLASIADRRLSPLAVLRQPVDDLYEHHWSMTGLGVPDAAASDQAVHLPGRNVLLTTKAALWCQLRGIERICMAPLATSPFMDASSSFFRPLERALNRSGLSSIRIERPFGSLTKREVLQLGRHLPLELTFSCLAPRGGGHCGTCNKCAERQRGFRDAGLCDRTEYHTKLAAR